MRTRLEHIEDGAGMMEQFDGSAEPEDSPEEIIRLRSVATRLALLGKTALSHRIRALLEQVEEPESNPKLLAFARLTRLSLRKAVLDTLEEAEHAVTVGETEEALLTELHAASDVTGSALVFGTPTSPAQRAAILLFHEGLPEDAMPEELGRRLRRILSVRETAVALQEFHPFRSLVAFVRGDEYRARGRPGVLSQALEQRLAERASAEGLRVVPHY
jgi:hypothetical protein